MADSEQHDLSSDELVAEVEAKRAALALKASDIKHGFTPAHVGEKIATTASETFDEFTQSVSEKPLLAAGGALAIAAFAAASYWGSAAFGKSSHTRIVGALPGEPAAADQQALASPVTGDVTSTPRSALDWGRVMDVAPKLALALAGGYLVEKMLPRKATEERLWEDVRLQLVDSVRKSTRRQVAELASSPKSPLPLLGVAAVIVRTLAKR